MLKLPVFPVLEAEKCSPFQPSLVAVLLTLTLACCRGVLVCWCGLLDCGLSPWRTCVPSLAPATVDLSLPASPSPVDVGTSLVPPYHLPIITCPSPPAHHHLPITTCPSLCHLPFLLHSAHLPTVPCHLSCVPCTSPPAFQCPSHLTAALISSLTSPVPGTGRPVIDFSPSP